MSDLHSALAELFAGPGARDYLGEHVTVAQHMLQAAGLARTAGAPDHLVVAALLHDIGHLTNLAGTATGDQLMAGRDNHHGDGGAAWLGRWFGPDVTDPVRLHVAAKRYLCTVEPGYHDRLSEASRYTLRVQGGLLGRGGVARFAAEPGCADAVAVRRWDDQAKDPGAATPALDEFTAVLDATRRA